MSKQLLKTSGAAVLSSGRKLRKTLGGGGCHQVRMKKIKCPNFNPLRTLFPCFKQTSRRLLERPKMPLPLFVFACERLGDRNGVDCVSHCLVIVNILAVVSPMVHHRVPN